MRSGKKLPKTFLPMLLCLFSMLLAACGGSGQSTTNTNKAAPNKQIYVAPLGGRSDIKSFDPAVTTDLLSIQAIDMVFTGLVQLNDKLQIVDQLAASHSVAADGTTWTFKLRPNLKFSDGKSLTSADVVYSIDRALDPNVKSAASPSYLNLVLDSDKRLAGKIPTLIGDSLLAPDPQTVIIKTNKKAAYFLDALSYSCSYVVEKSMVQKYGNNFADHLAQGIGGDGPFKVSKYIHGKEIDFVPNPYYYGKKPQLQKVIFPFYQNSDTEYSAYQANQIDTAGVPSPQLSAAKALSNNQFHQVPQLDLYYYTMNYLTKPFDNIKIRQAFALAINKNEIAQNVYHNTVIPTNHIVPQGMPGYDTNLKGPDGTTSLNGNPTLAKQLLQQGMKEEGITKLPPITITVSSGGSVDARNEFAAEQQMWKAALGVTVKIDDIDINKLFQEIPAATNNAKGLQMWKVDWIADYPDSQDFLTLQFDKGLPNNNMNYGQNTSSDAATQQQTQKLLEQADVNPDAASRAQQYYQAEQQAINDVAWLPIYQATSAYVLKPCVVGQVDNAEGLTPPDDWGNIYKTTASSCANVSQYH